MLCMKNQRKQHVLGYSFKLSAFICIPKIKCKLSSYMYIHIYVYVFCSVSFFYFLIHTICMEVLVLPTVSKKIR